MTSRNVPRLRFEGFGDEWNKEKLNNISKTFSGGTPKVGNKSYYGGDIAFIRSSEVLGERPLLSITKSGLDNSSAKLVDKNTLLYALYGATSGSVGLSKTAGAINQAVLAIIPDESHSKLFLKDVLDFKKNHIVNKFLQGGQGNLSAKIIKQLNIYFPLLPEQQHIGNFFSKLDHLIDLHSQKLEQLKKLKRGYLQKMFPQKGETVPRLRFSGFSGEWKKVKLGDISDVIGGGTPSTKNNEYWNGNINWYSPVEIGNSKYVDHSQKKITELGLKKSSATMLPKGTILFTSRAGIGKTAILSNKGCTNQGFQSIVPDNNKLDTEFIYAMTDILKRYGNRMGSGSTFVEISRKEMKKMPLLIPSFSEQQQIGSFFSKLDYFIDLYIQKIDQLKKVKHGYLQKMFI